MSDTKKTFEMALLEYSIFTDMSPDDAWKFLCTKANDDNLERKIENIFPDYSESVDDDDLGFFDKNHPRKNKETRTMQTGVRLSDSTITIGSYQTIMLSDDDSGKTMLSRMVEYGRNEIHWEDITTINEKQKSEIYFCSRKCNG